MTPRDLEDDPLYRQPIDPLASDPIVRADLQDDQRMSNATLGWIAGAVFVVVILALVFSFGDSGTQTASPTMPPAVTTGSAPQSDAQTPPVRGGEQPSTESLPSAPASPKIPGTPSSPQ